MANIKSAKKRVLVIEKKTLKNKMYKSALKTNIKKFFAAVESGDKAVAAEAYKVAVKNVDQAVAHGILAKNNAARKKEQIYPYAQRNELNTNQSIFLTGCFFVCSLFTFYRIFSLDKAVIFVYNVKRQTKGGHIHGKRHCNSK